MFKRLTVPGIQDICEEQKTNKHKLLHGHSYCLIQAQLKTSAHTTEYQRLINSVLMLCSWGTDDLQSLPSFLTACGSYMQHTSNSLFLHFLTF